MRKLFVVLFLISGLGLTAQDQTEEAGRYSYNLSSMVLSKYYGSIVGGIFYNRPLVFNDLMISRSDKAGSTYVDLWMSRPVTNLDWNRNGGDEYDFVLGRTLDLGKKKVDGQPTVRLDIAGTYLAVHPLTRFNGHVFTVATRADFPQVPVVQPYAMWYHFGKVGQNSPPAGEFFYGGLLRNQPTRLLIGDRKVAIDLDYRFGYSGGALGADWGPAYNRLYVGLNLPVSKRVTVKPTVIGQVPFTRRDPLGILGDRPRVFCTLSVTYHWGK